MCAGRYQGNYMFARSSECRKEKKQILRDSSENFGASVSGGRLRGVVLREDRSAVLESRRGMDDLAGLRFGEA